MYGAVGRVHQCRYLAIGIRRVEGSDARADNILTIAAYIPRQPEARTKVISIGFPDRLSLFAKRAIRAV